MPNPIQRYVETERPQQRPSILDLAVEERLFAYHELTFELVAGEERLERGWPELLGRYLGLPWPAAAVENPVLALTEADRLELDSIFGRLLAARRLLSVSGLRLKEIATQLGYANLYSFSKAFRQSFGLSPSAWRRGDGPLWHGSTPAGTGTE